MKGHIFIDAFFNDEFSRIYLGFLYISITDSRIHLAVEAEDIASISWLVEDADEASELVLPREIWIEKDAYYFDGFGDPYGAETEYRPEGDRRLKATKEADRKFDADRSSLFAICLRMIEAASRGEPFLEAYWGEEQGYNRSELPNLMSEVRNMMLGYPDLKDASCSSRESNNGSKFAKIRMTGENLDVDFLAAIRDDGFAVRDLVLGKAGDGRLLELSSCGELCFSDASSRRYKTDFFAKTLRKGSQVSVWSFHEMSRDLLEVEDVWFSTK